MNRTIRRVATTCLSASLLAGAAAMCVVLPGCREDAADDAAMVMQPADPSTRPSTRPTADPATQPSATAEDMVVAPIAYIFIDDEPFEFPSAKLWLKNEGGRIAAHLFSDDPPEAVSRGFDGLGFWFEMELELPADAALPAGTPVSPELLAGAEWVFRSETSERSDTPSGIFLGDSRQLQPVDVAVSFDPLDERFVVVTLFGTFAQFDKNKPGNLPERQVRVQAVLSAETLRN